MWLVRVRVVRMRIVRVRVVRMVRVVWVVWVVRVVVMMEPGSDVKSATDLRGHQRADGMG